ncbi:Cucumisin [Bertholletia excelsa]
MELAIAVFVTCILFGNYAVSTPAKRYTYIVHMDKSLMPKVFTSHDHWYASAVASVSPPGNGSHSPASLVYTYNTVLHGFSALLSQSELESIKNSPGFLSAYPDRTVKHRTTYTPQFLSLNRSVGLWPETHFGSDVIIAVVDSGIWPESRSFDDTDMAPVPARWKGKCEAGQEFNSSACNAKLIGARYFYKGLIANHPDVKISMKSARDTDGHGTHTASTVAGNSAVGASFFGYAEGTARGVAPAARVAAYKVLWDEGFYTSDILAGIDTAVADGVDVVSLSIGFDSDIPLYENPIAIASFGAVEKGVFVSHAGGNTGPGFGTLYDSIPWTLTVGAGSIDRSFAGKLTLGNGVEITGWTLFPDSALIEKLPLIYNSTLAFCNSTKLLAQAPEGIIICEDIGMKLTQLLYVAVSNLPAAILITDNPEVFEFEQFRWPGVVISPKDRKALIEYAKSSHHPRASISFKETIIGSKPAPAVASYSSRGPSRAVPGILKPDLIAPGTLVLAAWIPTRSAANIGLGLRLSSDFTLLSGTSMACPHAAGLAGLLKSARPGWSPSAIKSAMMTTANPLDKTYSPIRDYGSNFTYASPLDMGSGHVDPNRALDPGLVYDAGPEDFVNLLCQLNFKHKQILTITRRSNYRCSNGSSDANYPSFIALYGKKTTKMVHGFDRTLTNVGDGPATYRAEVVAPVGSKVTVKPQTLVFQRKYDKQSFTLTAAYESHGNGTMTYGYLTWVELEGSHRVRSPIVISPLEVN